MGGLAPDNDQPMPEEMRHYLQSTWRRIGDMLGTEFNHDFWTDCVPRRSTYPACRAVLAAELQNAAETMTDAIQRAYYLRALNPSDLAVLEQLADEIGLDSDQFATDIRSTAVDDALRQQVRFAANAPISGFPSLCLDVRGQLLPVRQDYRSADSTLQHLQELL